MINISSSTVVTTFFVLNSILLIYIISLVLYNKRIGCNKKAPERESILINYNNEFKFTAATIETDITK